MDNNAIMEVVYGLERQAETLRKEADYKRNNKAGRKYLAIRKRGVAQGLIMAAEKMRGLVTPTFFDEGLAEGFAREAKKR